MIGRHTDFPDVDTESVNVALDLFEGLKLDFSASKGPDWEGPLFTHLVLEQTLSKIIVQQRVLRDSTGILLAISVHGKKEKKLLRKEALNKEQDA